MCCVCDKGASSQLWLSIAIQQTTPNWTAISHYFSYFCVLTRQFLLPVSSAVTVRWWGWSRPKVSSLMWWLVPRPEWLESWELARPPSLWPPDTATLGFLTAWQSQDMRASSMEPGFLQGKCYKWTRQKLQVSQDLPMKSQTSFLPHSIDEESH